MSWLQLCEHLLLIFSHHSNLALFIKHERACTQRALQHRLHRPPWSPLRLRALLTLFLIFLICVIVLSRWRCSLWWSMIFLSYLVVMIMLLLLLFFIWVLKGGSWQFRDGFIALGGWVWQRSQGIDHTWIAHLCGLCALRDCTLISALIATVNKQLWSLGGALAYRLNTVVILYLQVIIIH